MFENEQKYCNAVWFFYSKGADWNEDIMKLRNKKTDEVLDSRKK